MVSIRLSLRGRRPWQSASLVFLCTRYFFVLLQHHEEGAGGDEDAADDGLEGEALVQVNASVCQTGAGFHAVKIVAEEHRAEVERINADVQQCAAGHGQQQACPPGQMPCQSGIQRHAGTGYILTGDTDVEHADLISKQNRRHLFPYIITLERRSASRMGISGYS